MQINVIVNGTFDIKKGAEGFQWTGTDIEAGDAEDRYLLNGSSNTVAEMDGKAGQITVMKQGFTIDASSLGTLSFDAAIRSHPEARPGKDGFTVTVSDNSGTIIFTQEIYPEETALEPYRFPVNFPSPGNYTLTLTESYNGDVPNDSYGAIVDNIALMVCLTRGTLIETPDGERLIEDLQAGDWITTMNGPQQLRWIGARMLNATDLARNEKLRPVRIAVGTLAHNLPHQDLLVSRQHRMLISSPIAHRMFASRDVLISAIKLAAWPGICIDMDCEEVTYFHMLFDRHEVIFANGAPTESLYTGPEALKALPDEAREEILTLFPELSTDYYIPIPAHPMPKGRHQRSLIARHLKNRQPLLC